MTLMFSRVARNFAKKGYFPTDTETLERIIGALSVSPGNPVRALDPCCGEGAALAEIQHRFGAESVVAHGIEIDRDRAWNAKALLDTVIHGDMQDCLIGPRSYGLLFLNPPYGDLLADCALTGSGDSDKRLEKLFYRRTVASLQYGGVLVLIIPATSPDKTLCSWISRSFERVQVFKAADRTFKQIVLFGIRRRQGSVSDAEATRRALLAINPQGTEDPVVPKEIPDTWSQPPYVLPAADGRVKFHHTRIDGDQLAEETRKHPCLWPQFPSLLDQSGKSPRRPLTAMSDWHLALALAAGQVSGIVRATDGRVMAIKGDTYKDQDVRQHIEDDEKGNEVLVITKTDKFVPVIRGLDLTVGSATYGETIVIR